MARKKRFSKRYGKKKHTMASARKSDVLNPHVVCKTIKHINMLFPERFCTKFKFAQQINYSGTTTKACGLGGNFLHNANTNTVTGMNYWPNTVYNQAMAMQGINLLIGNPNNNVGPYNTYRVNSSSIQLRCTSYGTALTPNVAPCYIAAYPVSLEAIGADALGYVNTWSVSQFREYQYAKLKQLAFGMNNGVSLNHTMSTAKIFGLKYKASLEDSNYSAQYGSNPEYNWAWIFVVFSDTSADVYDVEILQTITYEVEFFNRNVLANGVV